MKRYFRRRIDERQRADLRRVESYGYWIAFWLLLASVIVKSVIIGRPKEEGLTAVSYTHLDVYKRQGKEQDSQRVRNPKI